MKNIKFIIPLLLVSAFSLASITSCNKGTNIDTDFDGLTDDIDPDPTNNQYQVSLVTNTDEGKEETGELTLTMDYRDFITSGYKYNLGLLGSFFVNEVGSPYQPGVKNNVYPKNPTKESQVSPLLAQIGAKDITKITISTVKYEDDPYDVSDIVMGHHTFTSDNKKYQVYFVLVIPYPFRTGWVSNFDVGAVNGDGSFTDEYKELEGESHKDWVESNRVDHKGFSVTATRLLKAISEYKEQYKASDATPITYVTGHSRGGAVSNLIAKALVDNNQEVRAYCFNPANSTTAEDNVVKKEDYNSSIYNIINNGDLISHVPAFGFKLYGKYIQLDIDKVKYKEFMKKEYEGNTPDAVGEVEELLNRIVTKGGAASRDNFYDFRDKSTDYPERWEGTKDEMNQLKEELDEGYFMPNNSYARKCFGYDEPKQDPDDKDIYYIEYRTKPALIKSLLVDILDKQDLTYLLSYLKLLNRLITEAMEVYVISDFTALGVKNGHEQPIACVMAAQQQKN